MKLKCCLSFLLALSCILVLAGCGSSGTAVYVQSVKDLADMGAIAPGDRFSGLVVSENVAEIQKDGDKTIKGVIAETAKAVGSPIDVVRYARFERGEGIEKRKDNLAEEIAKMAQ